MTKREHELKLTEECHTASRFADMMRFNAEQCLLCALVWMNEGEEHRSIACQVEASYR